MLFDITEYDLEAVALTKAQVYEHIPHLHEFQLLDGFCAIDTGQRRGIAFADVRPDAWWVRGHFKGRPLLPGVLMLEMAAQASAVLSELRTGHERFVGLGGIEDCKFRESVSPPARVYFLCVEVSENSRRIVSEVQGVCHDHLVMQARITGLAI